jgi:lysophospholipid acyltransferase (LPLAT)-like uncharacterized protein
VLAQCFVHGAAQRRSGAFEAVSHMLGDVPSGRPMTVTVDGPEGYAITAHGG